MLDIRRPLRLDGKKHSPMAFSFKACGIIALQLHSIGLSATLITLPDLFKRLIGNSVSLL